MFFNAILLQLANYGHLGLLIKYQYTHWVDISLVALLYVKSSDHTGLTHITMLLVSKSSL